jgi:hypothetical protein
LTSQSTRWDKDTGRRSGLGSRRSGLGSRRGARSGPDLPRIALSALPYRGTFGDPRPPELAALALPPQPMPPRDGLRALKAWRYVGVFGPRVMVCVCSARIGPVQQRFWAVWDRKRRRFSQGRAGVGLELGRARVLDAGVQLDLRIEETVGVETVCHCGESYAWTRKQAGMRGHGTINMRGELISVDGRVVIDDTAAYYPHHTSWRWSAGVGAAADGQPVAWNLVEGINDPPAGSERTVWVSGEPHEVGPVSFAADLRSVGALQFDGEAAIERHQNLLLLRSDYSQPFGTFSGALPDGTTLREGYGVMEAHDVRW